MSVNFTQKLATYNTTSALIDGSYLDIENSTSKIGITIDNDDLFVIQDGSATGTANTGKVKAEDILTYIDANASFSSGDIESVTLTADTSTNACTDLTGAVSFDIEGGTNVATNTDTNKVTINVANATTSTLGAASFSSSDFDVATGAVSIKDNSITLDYMATLSAGDIIYGATSTGNPTALSAGSNDDVLTLASGVPTWAAPASPTLTWTITDGSTSNSAFATGETFQYTGGDSITATLADAGATTTLTIDLNETITVDTINIGDAAVSTAKTLWNTCTGAITIGASGGSVVIAGDLQVSGTTITTATETLEIADNTIVLNSDNASTSVDAGFVVQMGSGSGNNPSLWFDVAASSADTTGRWVVGSTDDTTATIGGYVADVMQVRIDNAAINTSSSEVPVGHMQYHDGELYLRVEDTV